MDSFGLQLPKVHNSESLIWPKSKTCKRTLNYLGAAEKLNKEPVLRYSAPPSLVG
jgi:hypothetical protein